MKNTTLCLLLVFFSFNVQSSVKSFSLKEGVVSFDMPSDWQESEQLFGTQRMLLGPVEGERRPVVIIESTEAENFHMNEKKLSASQDAYQKGRRNWAMKLGGKILDFIPYSYEKVSDKKERHSIGVSYQIGEQTFAENSHYFKCGNDLYLLKTLVPKSVEGKYRKVFNNVVETFKCEGEKQ